MCNAIIFKYDVNNIELRLTMNKVWTDEAWEDCEIVISRGGVSCKTSGVEVSNHFREVTKMVQRQ